MCGVFAVFLIPFKQNQHIEIYDGKFDELGKPVPSWEKLFSIDSLKQWNSLKYLRHDSSYKKCY